MNINRCAGFILLCISKPVLKPSAFFNAFSEGGQIETPLSEVAWSSAFGVCTDRFGTPWLILALDK
jgi:PhnB protein